MRETRDGLRKKLYAILDDGDEESLEFTILEERLSCGRFTSDTQEELNDGDVVVLGTDQYGCSTCVLYKET